jgi:hypothetical protein
MSNPEVDGISLGVRLAVFGKWSELHGHDADESPEIINSMKKKNLLFYDDQPIDSDDEEDQDESTPIEDIDYIKYLIEDCPYEYEMGIISVSYLYHDRLFGIKQFGIEKLQKKWRDYWEKKEKKIMLMKSIRNLRHREIYGKYPLF